MRFGAREIIFLIVLMAMPVGAWWFVFRPTNAEIRQARSEIQAKEQMLDKLSATTRQSADLARANAEVSKAISLIEARLPQGKDVDKILNQIADLARTSHLEIPKIKADKPVAAANYMEQPLDIVMTGDFDNFYTFLLKIEQLDRITRLLNLKLTRQEKDNGTMEAKFTLSIYFEPDAGDSPTPRVAAIAEPAPSTSGPAPIIRPSTTPPSTPAQTRTAAAGENKGSNQ